jgi:tRNA(His) 5'-end guanylyltransferase
VNGSQFEAAMRSREWFHGLAVPPGMWTVIRVDGRSFSRLTAEHFDKPFDPKFNDLMVRTAEALLREFEGRYAYTQSDEISVLLAPGHDLFDRSVEKLVSISVAVASSTFTLELQAAAQFDSRLWIGATTDDVADYFSWRTADSARNALNGWCYWTLRKDGMSARAATSKLDGLSVAEKNELLFQRGVNFNDMPSWQRRGVGLRWETYTKVGFDPIRQVQVEATRRRVAVDRELPMGDEYRRQIERMCGLTAPSDRIQEKAVR